MPGKYLLIAGGELDFSFVGEYLKSRSFDVTACADAGLGAARKLHLPVNFVMGDFDSVADEVLSEYRNLQNAESANVEFIQYPAEKDFTDLHLLVDWAVDQMPEEIVILGATGKRLDHFLANVNILMKPLSCGIPTYIVDRYNKLYLLDGRREIRREEMHGKYISFLPLTEKVQGVSLRGFRYELECRDMILGESIGVSNEIPEGTQSAVVDFAAGILIAVESRD